MKTLTVTVGGRVHIGSDYPIVPQTMCNTHTNDIEGTVAQCRRMAQAGSQLIRITVPGLQDVPHIAEIRRRLREEGIETPLVADIHFSSETAIAVAPVVEKVRINPGNFHKDHEEARRQFARFLAVCKEHGTAIRVGLNHGSLGEYITNLYGNTPFAMAKAAMEWLEMCIEAEFYQVVVSLKASNTVVMVEAYRQLAAMMQERGVVFPMHVGVTEAGGGDSGRIKSCVGISALLAEGIGNTVRVSLTEDPLAELPVARYLSERYSKKELTVCPQKACPPPDTGRGRGPSNASYREAMTPQAMGGAERAKRVSPFEGTLAAPCCTAHYDAVSREELLCAVACDWGKKLLDKEIDTVKIEGTYVDENGQTVAITPEFSAYLTDELLQACRRRFYRPEYIACPGCGRTMYDLQGAFAAVKERTGHLKDVVIAVMGCIVNGPGEMADADYGYVGEGGGRVTIYKGKTPVLRHIPDTEAVDRLVELIESDRS